MKDLISLLTDWSSSILRLTLHDFTRFSRNSGLSLAQMNVLIHLYYRGSCEITNFCEMMQVTPAGASQMIERMVQAGVVQRTEAPNDRRVRLVDLTLKGRQIVLESLAARHDIFDKIVEQLTPEEQEKISEALEILNKHTEGMDISPL